MKRAAFRFALPIIIAGFLLSNPACQPKAPDTRAADEQALREIEAEWSKATAAKDVERIVSFYAPGGVNCPANEPMETSIDAIRAGQKKFLGKPGLTLTSEVRRVEVSRSGDLGITHGTDSWSATDEKGRQTSDKGKWITVYRKQADGKWKVILNIGNSDLPAPAK
jgi:uncharacterized protein (TIGR02246 family)